LTIPSSVSDKTLQFSYIGYKTQEIAVGSKTRIDVRLESEEAQIDEVVVVGYGTLRKSDVTGAVSSVKINNRSTSSSRVMWPACRSPRETPLRAVP
jgi:hypothetical protein